MIQAYKYQDLYNKIVQEQSTEAFEAQGISAETYKAILEAHLSALYRPNFFISIALGLLTIIAVIFSALLVWLTSGADQDYAIVILFIFLSMVCYAALELFINSKQFYNAGVDNVLMCCSIIFLIAAFFTEDFSNNYLIMSGALMFFCLWLCIRFTDAFMAMLTVLTLYLFIFFLCIKAGDTVKAIAPFILMFLCAGIYLVSHKLLKKDSLLLYHFSCRTAELSALVLLYGSVNFYVVNEAGKQMFPDGMNMPSIVAVILWICTVTVPLVYMIYGILKKDVAVIRIAIVLSVIAVVTVHHYYALLPAEIDMLIGGSILIILSYALIKYLHTPKHGFSFENDRPTRKALLNAEALIMGQVFGKSHLKDKGFEFGGGSSGGGGATGNF